MIRRQETAGVGEDSDEAGEQDHLVAEKQRNAGNIERVEVEPDTCQRDRACEESGENPCA